MPVMRRLAMFDIKILVFLFRYASTMTMKIATQVRTYIDTLMSSELLVFMSLSICGNPDMRKSTPGK